MAAVSMTLLHHRPHLLGMQHSRDPRLPRKRWQARCSTAVLVDPCQCCRQHKRRALTQSQAALLHVHAAGRMLQQLQRTWVLSCNLLHLLGPQHLRPPHLMQRAKAAAATLKRPKRLQCRTLHAAVPRQIAMAQPQKLAKRRLLQLAPAEAAMAPRQRGLGLSKALRLCLPA